jgi:magnesium transporter
VLGIITAADAADVLEEEATEDVERLGGSEPLERPYLRTSARTLVWKRVRWLLALFVPRPIPARSSATTRAPSPRRCRWHSSSRC